MINLLIADSNIEYIKKIMYIINSTFDNVRIFNISTSAYETLEILNNSNDIDIVLLEMQNSFFNTKKIIEQLSKKDKYIKSVIILTNNSNLIEFVKTLESQIIYNIVSKKADSKVLIENINKLINEKSLNYDITSIRNKASEELTSIGYNLSHIGTKYLIDAVEISYSHNNNLTKNLNKNIYPLIAQRHMQTINNIKISINRATEAMYYNCRETILVNYFNLSTVQKPNIKTVIDTVTAKLIIN